MVDIKQWPGWETVGLIGRGSFGAVYEIQRDVFGDVEKAALKVISIPQNASDIDDMYGDGYDDESITSTFQSHLKSIVAEYSLMRKMNGCRNIVNCDDIRYVQHDDGFGWDIFIKMELLTPLMKTLPAEIPEETVVKLARDICNALVECKKHGIVHRDIKPQNIFLSARGDYKLGDFGIAKTVEKTMGGTKIGTYKYMAPEVYNNQPYGSAADIYSLGLVLYWMLNERRMPFLPLPPEKLSAGMEEKARMRRFSGEQLPPPANGSEELKQIVLKACAFDAGDRYASAQEMLNDLAGLEKREQDRTQEEEPRRKEQLRREEEVREQLRKAQEAQARLCAEQEAQEKLRRQQAEQSRLQAEKEAKSQQDSPKEAPLSNAVTAGKKLRIVAACVVIAIIALVLAVSYKEYSGGPTKLIEGSWENGEVSVTALDGTTLQVEITDDRPDQQHGELGTGWEIILNFGDKMMADEMLGAYPYGIILHSLAIRESPDVLNNLSFYQMVKRDDTTENPDDPFEIINLFSEDVDIEQIGNTYTATFTLPAWFDVHNVFTGWDISQLMVALYGDTTSDGYPIYEEGFSFYP